MWEKYPFSLLILIFLSLDLSLLSSSEHDAQLIWSVSNVGEQVRGYVVLYKLEKDRKAVWSFKRTLQQSQATLAPLQPLSNYTSWVLCYTASGKVYGSNTIDFSTTEGKKTWLTYFQKYAKIGFVPRGSECVRIQFSSWKLMFTEYLGFLEGSSNLSLMTLVHAPKEPRDRKPVTNP